MQSQKLILFFLMILLGACKQKALVLNSNDMYCRQEFGNPKIDFSHSSALTLAPTCIQKINAGSNLNNTDQYRFDQHIKGLNKQIELSLFGKSNHITRFHKIHYKPISEPDQKRHKPGRTLRIAGPLMIVGSLLITILVVSNIFLPGPWPWIFGVPMGIIFILGLIFFFVGLILLIKTRSDTEHQELRLKWAKYFFWIGLGLVVLGMLSLCIVWLAPTEALMASLSPFLGIGILSLFPAFFLLLSAWIMYARYKG